MCKGTPAYNIHDLKDRTAFVMWLVQGPVFQQVWHHFGWLRYQEPLVADDVSINEDGGPGVLPQTVEISG